MRVQTQRQTSEKAVAVSLVKIYKVYNIYIYMVYNDIQRRPAKGLMLRWMQDLG